MSAVSPFACTVKVAVTFARAVAIGAIFAASIPGISNFVILSAPQFASFAFAGGMKSFSSAGNDADERLFK